MTLILFSVSLFSFQGWPWLDSVRPAADHPLSGRYNRAIGIWRASEAKESVIYDKEADVLRIIVPPPPFCFDGKRVKMRLAPMKAWHNAHHDDYFVVEAKWLGDDLYWYPPYGHDYYKLASFANGRFEIRTDSGRLWVYEKVSKEKLTADEKGLADDNASR